MYLTKNCLRRLHCTIWCTKRAIPKSCKVYTFNSSAFKIHIIWLVFKRTNKKPNQTKKHHHTRPKNPNLTQAPKTIFRLKWAKTIISGIGIFKDIFMWPVHYHQDTSTRINTRRDSPNPKLLAPEVIANIPLEARASRSISLSHHIKAYWLYQSYFMKTITLRKEILLCRTVV